MKKDKADTPQALPLVWSFKEMMESDLDNVAVYFFDNDGQPQQGILTRSRHSLEVDAGGSKPFTWSSYGYNGVDFYNPEHPDFNLAQRAVQAKRAVAALFYDSTTLTNPDILSYIEAIADLMGEETIAKNEKRLRACGANSNHENKLCRMVRAITQG